MMQLNGLDKLVGDLLNKIDRIIDSIDRLTNAIASGSAQSPVVVTPVESATFPVGTVVTELKVVSEGEDTPWYIEAMKWLHKNEIDDRDTLEPFLGINPDDSAGGLSWCAAFMNSALKSVGLVGTGSNMALSFSEDWGQQCKICDGAIVVFVESNGRNGHVGIVCDDGVKILGGNQGDMVRKNNIAWYLSNRNLVGYFWPSEYKVPEGYEYESA